MTTSWKRRFDREYRAARPKVIARAGGMCEINGDQCEGRAVHVHHLLKHHHPEANALGHLLAGCDWCHRDVHANPARSYERGHLLHWEDGFTEAAQRRATAQKGHNQP